MQSLGRSGVFPGGELQGGLVVCKTQYVGFYSMRFFRSCPVAVYGYENVGLSFSRYGGAFLKRDEPVAVSCKVDVFYAETFPSSTSLCLSFLAILSVTFFSLRPLGPIAPGSCPP